MWFMVEDIALYPLVFRLENSCVKSATTSEAMNSYDSAEKQIRTDSEVPGRSCQCQQWLDNKN